MLSHSVSACLFMGVHCRLLKPHTVSFTLSMPDCFWFVPSWMRYTSFQETLHWFLGRPDHVVIKRSWACHEG